VLDLAEPPSSLPLKRVRFFQTDITKVEDIEKAVEGVVLWANETGAALGGVVNCAGVGPAAKVCFALLHGPGHSD
jgi:NAD(P)-dependent dehydrogenase (short-subunit alcohol dehydrogenase family)